MRIRLSYGRTGLWIDLPNRCDIEVIEPEWPSEIRNASSAIRQALRAPVGAPPLSTIARANDTVAIVFSDITRPAPNAMLLSSVLKELELRDVPRENITLINALGTHRPQSESELAKMLGREIVENYHITQHDCTDCSKLVFVGTSSLGHSSWLNRLYKEATVRIVTGLIEPHFFAGFSGGPKSVVPGLAGEKTILANHSPEMITSPSATWGCTEGNPVWMEMRELASMGGPAFLLNVCVNREKRITAVFAGDLVQGHARGVEFAKKVAVRQVQGLFDVVITSNSGYPLDQNLYQAVKGMSVAARIVKEGGHIIVAAECRDGVPACSNYAHLLRTISSPIELLERITSQRTLMPEQWQAQIQALVQMKAKVHIKSSYLSDADIRDAHLEPCHQIEETIERLLVEHSHKARICVLPDGPQTIPTPLKNKHVGLQDLGSEKQQ